MFENYTQDYFIDRFLSNAEADGVSTLEGSLTATAASLIAPVLEDCFSALEEVWSNAFADTADRESLIHLAALRGVTPKEGTPTVIIIGANSPDLSGATISDGTFNFTIDEAIETILEETTYYATALEIGTSSAKCGPTFEITEDPNETGFSDEITLKSVFRSGTDDEETEAFRERYFRSFITAPMTGNYEFFRDQAMSVDGVGNVLIKYEDSYTEGGVTHLHAVRILPVTDEGRADSSLTAKVQDQVISPFGFSILAQTPAEEQISVVVSDCEIESGFTFEDVEAGITEAVREYFVERNLEENEGFVLSASNTQLSARIAAVQGVKEIGGAGIDTGESEISGKIFSVPTVTVYPA